MSEQTQVYVLNYPPAYSRSHDGLLECAGGWSGNLEKKEKEKEEKGEKKRIP